MKYTDHFNTRSTPQNQSMRSDQVENSAGGYVWGVDDWKRLDRFLILGTEGGSYYASEQKLTVENAQAVLRCIKSDGRRVVTRVIDISVGGRAHKNDPALFVLAMAAGLGNEGTREYALDALSGVARTGTHLFTFLEYVQAFRGWGRMLRRGVSNWYVKKDVDNLAYQVVKYRQRNGWTHADALRKSHPVAKNSIQNDLFKWIVDRNPVPDIKLIKGYELAQQATRAAEIVDLIMDYRLPRECIPTEFLNDIDVWRALLVDMPLTAMIRNLGKMGSVGLLTPGAWEIIDLVCARLDNYEAVRKSRIHPISVLAALTTYDSGHGVRGKLSWNPVTQVQEALDRAFYFSFDNVEPTNKRTMLALDVSGSMAWEDMSGVPGLTPRVASAALAMVTARVEPKHLITAFSHEITPVNIGPTMNIPNILQEVDRLPFGRTDCALPMLYATNNRLEIDTFIVYTDSETWSGKVHPAQALREYREKSGIPAKLVVVGMVSNGFSIADPQDPGMLDVIGFDTATPQAISEFSGM